MRIVFLGSGEFGRAMLGALGAGGFVPGLVVTRPPRRRRRRGRIEPTPVQALADATGVPVLAPANVNDEESLDSLREAKAELFVVAEYGQLLRQPLLDIPPAGSINVHTSLLPRWRGATPVAAAIRAGDEEAGVSIQRVVRRLDAGAVLARRRLAIRDDDTTGTLTGRLAPLGADALLEVVLAIAAGEPPIEQPQDESQVTTCRRLGPEDALVDWSLAARAIERQVRAMAPKPGARTTLRRDPPLGLVVEIVALAAGHAEPGVVAAIGPEGFDVGTGEGLVRVTRLVPASRRSMGGCAFANGYRLSVGERLG